MSDSKATIELLGVQSKLLLKHKETSVMLNTITKIAVEEVNLNHNDDDCPKEWESINTFLCGTCGAINDNSGDCSECGSDEPKFELRG
jgi:hypothetical protein